MTSWFRSLDQILRGETTRLPDLLRKDFHVPVFGLSLTIMLLAAFYGACMGTSAVLARWATTTRYMGYEQVLASMVKAPMLFFLTLLITFPSLYVFNALVGSRLGMMALLRLLVAALAVMIAVLASFGPIAAFFALSTTSYSFMVVLHAIVFTVAGFLGLAFLLRTLQRLTLASLMRDQEAERAAAPAARSLPADVPAATDPPEPLPGAVDLVPGAAQTFSSPSAVPSFPSPTPRPGALERLEGHTPSAQVGKVFRVWIIVFALVGAQMAWILRPFIGDPAKPFEFFRARESNFFTALLGHLMQLFGVNWRG